MNDEVWSFPDNLYPISPAWAGTWWDVQQARAVPLLWWVGITKHPHCVCSSWPGRISSDLGALFASAECTEVVQVWWNWKGKCQSDRNISGIQTFGGDFGWYWNKPKQTWQWAPWELCTVPASPVKVAPPENALAASPWWALHLPCPEDSERQKGFFVSASLAAPSAGTEFIADPALRACHCH